MNLGIRGHDLGDKCSIEEFINRINKYNFKNIQLVYKKTFNDSFNIDSIRILSKKLKENNITVALLGAYFNPVHSNKNLLKENIEYFKKNLECASLLNAKYVGTETGSYNDDKWTYNPKNHTEEAYEEVLNIFKDLVKVAENNNVNILIEPAYAHVIYNIDVLEKIFEDLSSKNVFATIDIFNLLYIENYMNYKEIFTDALNRLNDKVKIIHLKDFYVQDNKIIQTSLGKGIIDFKFIIKTIKKYCPNATLIFEGVVGEDNIISSKKLIDSLID